MPAAQMPPERDAFRLDRFRPAVHRVETPGYDRLAAGFREYLLRGREQSAFLKIKYGLIDAEGELDRIASLEQDWDTYGANPPSPDAIRASRESLQALAEALILPSAIVPSAEGGVSIYFIRGKRTVYLESDNQGSQALVMYDRDGNAEVLEIDRDMPRADVSSRILAYLG